MVGLSLTTPRAVVLYKRPHHAVLFPILSDVMRFEQESVWKEALHRLFALGTSQAERTAKLRMVREFTLRNVPPIHRPAQLCNAGHLRVPRKGLNLVAGHILPLIHFSSLNPHIEMAM